MAIQLHFEEGNFTTEFQRFDGPLAARQWAVYRPVPMEDLSTF